MPNILKVYQLGDVLIVQMEIKDDNDIVIVCAIGRLDHIPGRDRGICYEAEPQV